MFNEDEKKYTELEKIQGELQGWIMGFAMGIALGFVASALLSGC
jgi:hypothetical protein